MLLVLFKRFVRKSGERNRKDDNPPERSLQTGSLQDRELKDSGASGSGSQVSELPDRSPLDSGLPDRSQMDGYLQDHGAQNGGGQHRAPGKAGQVEEQVLLIQQGDRDLQERFLADYRPFVARVASRFSRRYIDPSHDDEFSVAFQAFHEAVMSFSAKSGNSFLHFAETVIRRRLIDYARKEKKHRAQIPYSSFDTEDDENNVINPVETMHAIERFAEAEKARERRSEIAEINKSLQSFGITFSDLAEASPKHADSRNMLMEIGRRLAQDETLFGLLMTKKMLPIKELLERVDVSRKTLERNRKYIIAIALIHSGSYPYLQDYVQPAEYPKPIGKEGGIHA